MSTRATHARRGRRRAGPAWFAAVLYGVGDQSSSVAVTMTPSGAR